MTLFDKIDKIAENTGIDGVINMVETFSPFSELVKYVGENPTEKDLIDFYVDDEYFDKAKEIVEKGYYDQAVNLMDDGIREKLHKALVPCNNAYFLAVYMAEHNRVFNEDFTI